MELAGATGVRWCVVELAHTGPDRSWLAARHSYFAIVPDIMLLAALFSQPHTVPS
ncbi:hypothetical protein [Lentzea atacamensis]|uniref:hypothetical protein n=1 Tax=Lentzea atacamensis TaxID=531938 RepID=UPI001472CA10|nr:hypothetical protein [Lentzea atacamensis]